MVFAKTAGVSATLALAGLLQVSHDQKSWFDQSYIVQS